MQGARRQLLAGAGFAGNQHGGPAGADQPDQVAHLAHGAAVSHQQTLPVFRAGSRRELSDIVSAAVIESLFDLLEFLSWRHQKPMDTETRQPHSIIERGRRIPDQHRGPGRQTPDLLDQVGGGPVGYWKIQHNHPVVLPGEVIYSCCRVQVLNRPGRSPGAILCRRSILVAANPQDLRSVHSWLLQAIGGIHRNFRIHPN